MFKYIVRIRKFPKQFCKEKIQQYYFNFSTVIIREWRLLIQSHSRATAKLYLEVLNLILYFINIVVSKMRISCICLSALTVSMRHIITFGVPAHLQFYNFLFISYDLGISNICEHCKIVRHMH